MTAIDLLLRIAVAFLRDVNLEEFKRLVYETEYLLTDINSFENDKIPKDAKHTGKDTSSHKISQVSVSSNVAQESTKIRNLTSEFSINSPRYEAELLLCHILRLTRVELHAHYHREISDYDKQRYFKLLAMRKNGTPIEYLINKASFFSLEFYVDNSVLIPRNETEILVEKAIELIQREHITHFIEIGTGSGAISIALLRNVSNLYAIATDISNQALHIAIHNAKQHAVDDRCNFIESDLLDSDYLPSTLSIPLLIANPPYIANHYPLNQEVLCEPHIALFGGEKGDEILKKLIIQARQRNIIYLLCEMGYNQKESMREILNQVGYKAEFYKDYAGFDRGFVATLMPS
ncbi:peptide chain release factor N(5)-glutamine methyltransferase [Helicobacter sp. MIT 14-3879]|uniref:peptide chain release factor N(5)-glutamine methyltransferase n=1 Tax=Helicobacter sp. MIT 14-3879 TaxID=2040649 RepID=UPI000E1F9C99|nr:peptide chain release factor N(5)-glutamine methyltransferase [Helicobacter sp. MIT 14-3879]RDU60408.1 peptide chain release factor N(5)-glutamine methyltransferase [Helicobacter sp. MIT 14-3879]